MRPPIDRHQTTFKNNFSPSRGIFPIARGRPFHRSPNFLWALKTRGCLACIVLSLSWLFAAYPVHSASSPDSGQPILLLFQQPAFSYFDLFTNSMRCHGIKSVVTPTNCEYDCVRPCWATHSPQLAPVADALVFNLPEWADHSNFTLVGPDPRSKGHQAWVLIHTESSQPDQRRNYGQFLTSASFMRHFDVLVSWVRNSDVFMPPWELHMQLPLQVHFSGSDELGNEDSLMRRRLDGALAATWVSNCIASNNRTQLLQDLMRSVPTHSFGQCFNNARMPPEADFMGSSFSSERHVLRKDNWQVNSPGRFSLASFHACAPSRCFFTKCLAARNVEDAARRRCQDSRDEALFICFCV